MNMNQLWSTLRFVLSFGGGILVTFGYLSTEQLTSITTSLMQIAGPLSALAALAFSLYTHTKAQTVAKAADIVVVAPAQQKRVGIVEPQIVPTAPPAPSKQV